MSLLEASIDSQYFMENYEETTITITSTENGGGVLETDVLGNYLNSGLIGLQSVYKCTKFTGITSNRYILFHNSDDEMLGMIKGTYNKQTGDISGIKNNFSIKGQDLIYYKINASIENQEFNGNTVEFDTLGIETIFKVYLNGDEVTAYSRSDGTIIFDSGVANSFGNQAFVIFYPQLQTVIGVDIKLFYYSPYKHEVTLNDELLLGYQLAGTVSVTSETNVITTTSDLSSVLSEYDYIRIGTEVRQVLQINVTPLTIKVDAIFEESYSGEDIYYIPYILFANIESPTENPTSQFYEFNTPGVKLPVKIKQSVSNAFAFNYFVDEDMEVNTCGIYRYATDEFDAHVPENNRFRIIRAYYENDDIDKFIYLTNCRKLDPSKYTKGNYDKYDASVEFEDKLTLKMNLNWSTTDGILGAGGAGNYRLIRS